MPLLDLPNDYYELPKGKIANVATFLEMKQLPSRPLAAFASSLSLTTFSSNDLSVYRQMFRNVGQDLMWSSRLLMSDEKLAKTLSSQAVESYCLRQNGVPIGLLELDFRDMPNCELAFFGLVPSAIGGGLGRAMMDESIRRAWAKPISRFWVHTCTDDHPAALPFYIRSGFTPYARKVEIMDDPRLLGELPLSASPRTPVIR